MSFLVIFGLFAATLFAMVFFTKRRFGVLGLALAAGAMLGAMWVKDLTPLIASAGVSVSQPPLETIVLAGLILLPALVLLPTAPAYKILPQRLIGASAFALLALALLLEPIGSALVIDAAGQPVYDTFLQYRTAIITFCLGLALLDIWLARVPKRRQMH